MPRTVVVELGIQGSQATDFRVTSVEIDEGLSRPFSVRVVAICATPPVVDDALGQPGSLVVHVDDEPRGWFGVLAGLEVEAMHSQLWHVRATLVPHLALLDLGRDHRAFQEKSVKDVAQTVLEAGGCKVDLSRLGARYEPRKWIVQWGESDLDFVSRICADEGIGLAVWNDAAARLDQVVLFDDATQLPATGKTLIDRAASAGRLDSAVEPEIARRTGSDAVMLRDYDLEHPGQELRAQASAPKSTGREVYVHPGGWGVADGQGRGDRLAKVVLERLRAEAATLHTTTDCPWLEPGRRFELASHPRPDGNTDWLVVSVSHRFYTPAGQAAAITYENHVVCVPKTVKWRPARRPAPKIGGAQNAFVTAPSGQEQHSEQFGRVKVRFPWDRSGITDDKSSTWLRVGQLPLSGSMVLPREGFEVLVDFEQGDLERPMVAGHLYNGEQGPPYALPGAATRGSIQSATLSGGPGANELRFEDAAGAEEIFINASHDHVQSVENDAEVRVLNNETITIGANSSLSVGTDLLVKIVADRSVTVAAAMNVNVDGRFSEGAGGSHSLSVGGMRKVQVGGDWSESTKGTLSRDVGALQSVTAIKGIARKTAGSSTQTVGGAWLEMTAASRSLSVSTLFTETIGALKLIKASNVSVACKGAYSMQAAVENVKCGGNRTDGAKGAVAITGGAMKVDAGDVNIEAKSKLVLRGGACTITLESSGKVHIKAPTIKLKGSKDLTQIQHKSN